MTNPFEIIDARLSTIENLLLELKHPEKSKSTNSESEAWFNVEQLQNYLPDKPARATIYGWVHTLNIPFHKGGKKLRFLKSEIDNWLLQGKRQTRDQIALDAKSYMDLRKKRG